MSPHRDITRPTTHTPLPARPALVTSWRTALVMIAPQGYSGRFGRVAAALACRSARVRVVGRNWTLPQRRCRPLPPHAGHCRCA